MRLMSFSVRRTLALATLPALVALAGCTAPAQGSGWADAAVPDGGDASDASDTADSIDTAGLSDSGDVADLDTDLDGGAGDSAADSAADAASDAPDVAADAADADAADAADTGPSPTSACASYVCGATTFAFAPPSGAATVKLAGTMNAWKLDAAPELLDPDGDGTFEVTLTLSPGTYDYKFVADDKWYQDPANPTGVDDGYGGKNSRLVVAACQGPLELLTYATDQGAQSFTASFAVVQAPVALADLSVSVDGKAQPPSTLSWLVADKTLQLALPGLAKGLHDVRLGCGVHSHLLKVAIGTSEDWRDSVLYFAMTDRFVNGDASNDAPHPNLPAATNWQGGDFKGIEQRIADGYFDQLGVGALWISWPAAQPVEPEPGTYPDASGCNLDPKKIAQLPVAFSGYHGYWPVLPDSVEPRFGSLAALQSLVHAAHAKGIRVLLDFTANHVHTSSPWFKDHQDDGWFHLPAQVCGDIGWDSKPVECWFTNYLADFDHDGPARYALLDSAIAWAKTTGVDGFRVDAVKHVEMGFVEDLRRRVEDELEHTGVPFWLVGETFTGEASAIKAFVSPTRLHGQFDFAGNYALLETFAKNAKGLDALDASWRASFAVYGGDALMSTFLGNHDIARFLSVAAGSLKCWVWDIVSDQAAGWKDPPGPVDSAEPYERLRLGFAWLYAVPGIPLVYYGDEFGMPGAGDPDNRRMMRFGDQLTPHEKATLAVLQTLGAARKAHVALRKGSWAPPLWQDGDTIAFARTHDADRVLVALHKGNSERTITVDVAAVGWADGTTLVDALAAKGGAAMSVQVQGGKVTLVLPPRRAVYLSAN